MSGAAVTLADAAAGSWTLRRLELDDTHLSFVDVGAQDAEAVVLLHGYLGSHMTWRHQIDVLAERYRVIAPDWFGWGRSGRDPRLRYDYDTEIYRLRRVLDVLRIENCNLVGHDYGGFLALGFAQRHPNRVRRLAIVNSRAHATFKLGWYTTFGLLSLAARTPVLSQALAKLPLERIHRWLMKPGLARGIFDAAAVDSYVSWMSSDPHGAAFFVRFYQDYRVGVRSELARQLRRIACPTAVIWGTRDRYLSNDIPQELAVSIPRAKLTMIYGAGHFVTEQRAREVLGALEELLTTKPFGRLELTNGVETAPQTP